MLIANISPQPLTVLSFDRERRPMVRNSRVKFRWAKPKQIRIAQSGLVFPFRADLFIELHAIARERSADHILVELDSNAGTSIGQRQVGDVGLVNRYVMQSCKFRISPRLLNHRGCKVETDNQTIWADE